MSCPSVRAAVACCAALLSLAVPSGPTYAQQGRNALPSGVHPEAHHHFKMGQRMFLNRNFAGAAKEFAAAERYAPDSPVIAFHKAQAQERSGDLDAAIIGYESYLDRRPDAPDRADVERLIGVVRARVEAAKPLISIESEPTGARVYIDAGSPEDGPTGITPLAVRIHPGPHRVYVELEGHQPIDRVIELDRPRTLRFRLAKFDSPAILTIGGMDADSEGAPVFVDGIKRGRVPATIELEPGAHIVEVTKEGFHTWISEYSLRRGQRMHIDMVLEPEFERMNFGLESSSRLVVSSVPKGAKVLLDDRPFGATPIELSGLTPGTHSLRLQLGDETVLRSITLAPEKVGRFHHRFEAPPPPDPAEVVEADPAPVAPPQPPPRRERPALTVATIPPDAGALVEIDGKEGGPAPWTGVVQAGRRSVLIQARGFETVIRDVEVPANSEVTVTVPLRPAQPAAVAPARRPPPMGTPRRALPDRPLPARDRPGRTWVAGAVSTTDQERRTLRVSGAGDSSADVARDGARLGLSVRWAKFLADSAELGVGVELQFADTGQGGGDQSLSIDPFLRLRHPLRGEDGEWGELYLMGGAGLAAVHADEAVEGGRIEAFGGGWSAGWAGGGQLTLTPELAFFSDVGWRHRGVTHTLIEAGGASVDRSAYDRRWTELTVTVGLAYSR